ncbi:transcription termination factor MTEF1, chloroplastic-like isoform X2 [Miscanthus floridulus]|uniref:transcription termination factor MTEF1, chloroplastic-like isoform X2 n=1 Tax=Miscanthus floridulus TaxID=154761 RepID=UPI003457DA6A
MLRLRNSLLPLLRAASPLPSPIHIHPCACRLLSTSTSAATAAFSLEDYLVAACGIAPAQAREVSKKALHQLSKITHSRFISAASNPDAIIALLSGVGLSRADIAAVVSANPLLLRASVKRISPRLLALRDRAGLSTPQIARFLLVLVVLKRNDRLMTASLERLIKPNIALLRQWGVRDIVQLCSNNAWVLTFNPERVKEFLLRAEQLGVPPTSRMFRHAVAVVTGKPKEKVAAKLEFFKRTLGCSESEVSTAICKVPAILGLSDEILLRKIDFLVNEAAMEPRHIVERPVLLAYSLEKRLVPRHYVMKVLRGKGLLSKMSLYTLAKLGEETFKLRFIDCHKDSVPGLADAYATACTGIVVPSRV